MPSLVRFPAPGDPRLLVASLLLSTVLLVLQLANAGSGLA
jgi:hypothetical protein